jgi:hypothetical protein
MFVCGVVAGPGYVFAVVVGVFVLVDVMVVRVVVVGGVVLASYVCVCVCLGMSEHIN